jgi:hypothetical protein
LPILEEEWARWTGWAGSPQLIAHIGHTAERALREGQSAPVTGDVPGTPVDFRATVLVEDDAEVFESNEDLLANITPEALSGEPVIELAVRSGDVNVLVAFGFAGNSKTGVRLTVSGPRGRHDEIAVIAATIAMSVRRGFRRYLGSVEFSAGLCEGHVGARAPLASLVEMATPVALGAATGLAFALCIKVFLPHADIPPWAKSALPFGLGAAYPLWLRYAVPDVELAVEGKTRLQRTTTRAVVTLLTLLITSAGRVLIGGS